MHADHTILLNVKRKLHYVEVAGSRGVRRIELADTEILREGLAEL